MKNRLSTKYIVLIALMSAVSYVLVAVCKIIPDVAGFLSYEPKDVIIVISGFILGPLSCILISAIVSLFEMITISSTGLYGLVMNVVSTCAFAIPAVIFYKKYHSRKGAVAGLITGVLSMTAFMLAWNYALTPLFMGVERSIVADMLIPVFLPFNLIKGGLNAALTMILYKPVVTALRRAGMVAESKNNGKKKFSTVYFIVLMTVAVTFVLLLLAMMGIIR